ncbi:MAG: type II toxin-antitoxin system prevent-host-death family antitoxin [Opitutus sp.]|nr:type II toxin-antitoxin system prevent-host-death family antitoxin [Opitutus sp.]
MKKKKRINPVYPKVKDNAAQIRKDAALYGLRRDVLGVREVKDQLSSLLQRAAGGEEIVVTSDGVPTAMIVRYKPVIRGKPFQPNWALLRSMPMTSDSTPHIRAERDGEP